MPRSSTAIDDAETRARIERYVKLLNPSQRGRFTSLPPKEQVRVVESVSIPARADPHFDPSFDPDFTPDDEQKPDPDSPSFIIIDDDDDDDDDAQPSSTASTAPTTPTTPTRAAIAPRLSSHALPLPELRCCTAALHTLRTSLLTAERALAVFDSRLSSLLLTATDDLATAEFQQHTLAALPAEAFAPGAGGEAKKWLAELMAGLGVRESLPERPTRWMLQRRCLELHLAALEAGLGRTARRVGRALRTAEEEVGANLPFGRPDHREGNRGRKRRRAASSTSIGRDVAYGDDADADADADADDEERPWWRLSFSGFLHQLHPSLPGASPPALPLVPPTTPASPRQRRRRRDADDEYVKRRGSHVRLRLHRHERRENGDRTHPSDAGNGQKERGAHVWEHLGVVRTGLGRLRERMQLLREGYQIRADDDEYEGRYGRRGSENEDGVERVFGRGVEQLKELRGAWVRFAEEMGRVG